MTKRQNLQINYSLSLRRLSFPQRFVMKIVEHTELKECLEELFCSLCLASLLVSAACLPIQPEDCYLAFSLHFRVFQGSSDFGLESKGLLEMVLGRVLGHLVRGAVLAERGNTRAECGSLVRGSHSAGSWFNLGSGRTAFCCVTVDLVQM